MRRHPLCAARPRPSDPVLPLVVVIDENGNTLSSFITSIVQMTISRLMCDRFDQPLTDAVVSLRASALHTVS